MRFRIKFTNNQFKTIRVGNAQQYEIYIFGVFFWHCRRIFFRSPAVGGFWDVGWYFCPILGFGGFQVFFFVAGQWFSSHSIPNANYLCIGFVPGGMAETKRSNLKHLIQNADTVIQFPTTCRNKPRREFKGQQNRGNRTESLWEEICLWEGLWEGGFAEIFERLWEILRCFERFSEFLRGFQRFFRGFQRSSQRPSQRQISSQRPSVRLPLIVLPLELSPKTTHSGGSASFIKPWWFCKEHVDKTWKVHERATVGDIGWHPPGPLWYSHWEQCVDDSGLASQQLIIVLPSYVGECHFQDIHHSHWKPVALSQGWVSGVGAWVWAWPAPLDFWHWWQILGAEDLWSRWFIHVCCGFKAWERPIAESNVRTWSRKVFVCQERVSGSGKSAQLPGKFGALPGNFPGECLTPLVLTPW